MSVLIVAVPVCSSSKATSSGTGLATEQIRGVQKDLLEAQQCMVCAKLWIYAPGTQAFSIFGVVYYHCKVTKARGIFLFHSEGHVPIAIRLLTVPMGEFR